MKKQLLIILLATLLPLAAWGDKWIDVTNNFLNNPSFMSEADGWIVTEDAETVYQSAVYDLMEVYNGTFDIHQMLSGVPKGKYRLTIQAFYRAGGNDVAYPVRTSGNEDITAVIYAGNKTQAVKSVYDYSFTWNAAEDCWTPDGSAYYPNGMVSAREAFNNGAYLNSLEFEVENELEIGIRNGSDIPYNWCCFYRFKLEYYGNTNDLEYKTWTDPATKVNYEYLPKSGEGRVKAGSGYYHAGSPEALGGNLAILEKFTVDGKEYKVTSIGDYALPHCGITTLTIPKGVHSIGVSAFADCKNIKRVVLYADVKHFSHDSFDQCKNIETLELHCKEFSELFQYDTKTNVKTLILGDELQIINDLAFASSSSLTSITLPPNLKTIGKGAFSGCESLTSLDIPESVTSISERAFGSCSGLQSVTLPSSINSISDYMFISCENLKSITIPSSIRTIGMEAFSDCGLSSIDIPEGLEQIGYMAFYQCENLTKVTIPSTVNNIAGFAFGYCKKLEKFYSYILDPMPIPGTVFSYSSMPKLYVPIGTKEKYKAASGWPSNIEESIPVGNTYSLVVNDETGSDITEKVSVIWYDAEGKQLGTSKTISGLEDNVTLYYSVILNENLGRIYREVKMQKVVASNGIVTCQLERIGRVTLEGRVSATDIDKTTATINVRQMLNGKWEQTYTTQTNEQGLFSLEVFDDETDITISGEGYLNATLHRDGFSGNGNVGTIPLSLISGFAIAANITMKAAVADGEAEEATAWTDGLNNIDFMLTNTTTGTAITDFTVQNGNVIIKTGADIGHEISLTAKSKQGVFADATTTFTIAEGANSFDLQLTELGGVDATCAGSSNGSTSGYLYDGAGTLVAQGSYAGETLSIRHLKSGSYTLVSMGMGSLFGSMAHLSDLSAIGLSEGNDYVTTSVSIADGQLTAVSVSEVPRLDETRFYYTSENTYFNVNKAAVTVGDYLTLQAHVDFKPEYAGKANGVTLTIDLPEGCELVENSVIANRQAVPHSVNGNRVTMTLNKEQYGSQVRFCIIPTISQSYSVTAIASFDIDGQVQQPIGTAQFETKGLSLEVPSLTISTNVTVNGTAKGHSEVSIYDNNVLVGKTTSKADGSWSVQCELYKPYSHSFHDIYAKIVTDGGMELTSETKQVEYDKNSLVPEKVTMLYRSYNVIFDLLEGTTSPSYYSYAPGNSDFTFLANFTRNDTTQIKNVNIKVLNSDGTVRTLPATFDGKQGKWVATTRYNNASRLPQNVKVEYVNTYNGIVADKERSENEKKEILNLIMNCGDNIVNANPVIVEENDISLQLDYLSEGNGKKRLSVHFISEEELNEYVISKFNIENERTTCTLGDTVLDNKTIIVLKIDSICYELNFEDIESNKSSRKVAGDNSNGNNKILNNLVRAINRLPYVGAGEEWIRRCDEVNYWRQIYYKCLENHRGYEAHTYQLLLAKCSNGEYKVSPLNQSLFEIDLRDYNSLLAERMESQLYDKIEQYEASIARRLYIFAGIQAVLATSSYIMKEATAIGQSFQKALENAGGLICLIEGLQESDLINRFGNGVVSTGFNQSWSEEMEEWYKNEENKILQEYLSLNEKIISAYKTCINPINGDGNGDGDGFNGKGSTPQIDPSGYVYEAVTSNRLEGVTATCYQKVTGEDMYGDVTEETVVWNAADYSQVNPQLTDETGFYRWDVPQGMWQVKYEKAGYETAYSEWLPVPPPQLDVNIGMKQSTPPTVEKMRGTESGITVSMSKYMRPETLNEGSVTVTRNGMAEKGRIELLNLEQEPKGSHSFASKLKFVPEFRFRTSDEVYVTIHKDVESYCGVKMAQDHTEKVEIESEITDIVADSTMTVAYQETRDIQVLVMPKEAAAGRVLTAQSSSPMIASLSSTQATIDANGLATLTLRGELPGGVVLTLGVDGTDVTTTSKVQVVIGRELTAMPVASIRNGEQVAEGTKLTLTCATKGATIYYTLDGTCPCNTQTRQKYTGPIVLPIGTVTVKAMAVADDMDDSDVATFIYVVGEGDGIDTAQAQNLEMSWHDGQLAISGAEGGTVRVYDIEGREIASRNNVKGKISIQMAGRPVTCTYIVCVTTRKGHTLVQKVTVP